MACLSVFPPEGRIAVVCANPIYFAEPRELREGAKLLFETLDEDAFSLKALIGEAQLFVLDSRAFWGTLQSLQQSTAPLLGKPAVRGTILVHSEMGPMEHRLQN